MEIKNTTKDKDLSVVPSSEGASHKKTTFLNETGLDVLNAFFAMSKNQCNTYLFPVLLRETYGDLFISLLA